MVYLYKACDQKSDFCHQQLLRKMRRKKSWTDGRTDRQTEVKQYTLLPLRGYKNGCMNSPDFSQFIILKRAPRYCIPKHILNVNSISGSYGTVVLKYNKWLQKFIEIHCIIEPVVPQGWTIPEPVLPNTILTFFPGLAAMILKS